MSTFSVHNAAQAPEASRPVLDKAQKTLGFVPNLYGVLAESPAALNAYTQIGAALDAHGSLNAVERNLVAVAISREAGCEYCVAAHSTLATLVKTRPDVLEAVRAGKTVDDPRLEALRQFALAVVRERGWVGQDALDAFYAAGYERKHVLDVITLAALKTLSNYTNHIAETDVDAAFSAQAWKREG